MSEPQTIFRIQHDATTRIGVTLEPVTGKGSLVVSVYRQGTERPQRIRYAAPQDVTAWFRANSAANVERWRDAYHSQHLPLIVAPETAVVEAEVRPRMVPYHSQRDNERSPGGTCNVTSYAMVLDYFDLPTLEKKCDQIEDNLSLWMEKHHLDRHAHGDLVQMARAHRLDASFDTNVTLNEMRDSLSAGHILVVSGKFTSAGHIICVYGTKGTGFQVHDPFGNYLDRYHDHNGAHLIYSARTMAHVLIELRPGSGAWVHTIRGVLSK